MKRRIKTTMFRYLLLFFAVVEIVYKLGRQEIDWRVFAGIAIYIIVFQIRYFYDVSRAVIEGALIVEVICFMTITVVADRAFLFWPPVIFFDGWSMTTHPFASTLSVSLLLFQGAYAVVGRSADGALAFCVQLLFALVLARLFAVEEKNQGLESALTEQRQKENDMIRSNIEMEQYIGSMRELYTLKERNRISRDIHDSVGHSLSTMIVQLGAIESVAERDPKQAKEMASHLKGFAAKSMDEVRKVLKAMKPGEWSEQKLAAALDEMIYEYRRNTGIKVFFIKNEETWDLEEREELALYRAVQEFLSNAYKHGKATEVKVVLHFNEDELILTMTDNGVGAEKIIPNVGLTGLKERVREIRGTIRWESAPGDGFLVQIVLRKKQGELA